MIPVIVVVNVVGALAAIGGVILALARRAPWLGVIGLALLAIEQISIPIAVYVVASLGGELVEVVDALGVLISIPGLVFLYAGLGFFGRPAPGPPPGPPSR